MDKVKEVKCQLCGYWLDEGQLSKRGFCGICEIAFQLGFDSAFGPKNEVSA